MREAKGEATAERCRLLRLWRAWREVASSDLEPGQAEVTDAEPLMESTDPSPARRVELKQRLRYFLMNGQKEWKEDGGVEVTRPVRDPVMVPIWDLIVSARKRRPTRRAAWGERVDDQVGSYWELSDFESVPQSLYDQLRELLDLEEEQVTYFCEKGTYKGDVTSPEGAIELGLGETVAAEWREGIRLPMDEPEPYSRAPYSAVFSNLYVLGQACEEINRSVRVGKLLPLRCLPLIESPTSALVKPSPSDPSGFKVRTCVDLTKSGVNPKLAPPPFAMPTVATMIQHVGPSWYMAKQDVRDMFLCWKVHPSFWGVLGLQHPMTGQTYVYPVLPFGLSVSPFYACSNTESLAGVIRTEASALAQGLQTLPCLARSDEGKIRLAYMLSGRDPAVQPPTSEVYVDDFAMFAPTFEACQELIELACDVFATANVPEKVTKREGPSQSIVLLGFEFNTVSGVLSIPHHKCQELLDTLASLLRRGRAGQSVSWHELASITGKLTWAASGIQVGRVFIRHMRKPCTAVQDVLATRAERERFCIPLGQFPKAMGELEWWVEALRANEGKHRWHVGTNGLYAPWVWLGLFGGQVPADVLQFATDASRLGGCLVFDSEYRELAWKRRERQHHINVLEAIMILDWCVEFGPQARGRRVLAWCDNSVTVAAVNKGSSRSNVITGIVRRIRLLSLQYDFHLCAAHIPGRVNYAPDSLSRGLLHTKINNYRLTGRSWGRWDKALGPFDRELFAPITGHGVRTTHFCSASDTPFGQSFQGERVWANPPADLAPKFLQYARSFKAHTLVALLPTDIMGGEEGADWEQCVAYRGDCNLLERPVGARWVGAKGQGLRRGVYRLRDLAGGVVGEGGVSAEGAGAMEVDVGADVDWDSDRTISWDASDSPRVQFESVAAGEDVEANAGVQEQAGEGQLAAEAEPAHASPGGSWRCPYSRPCLSLNGVRLPRYLESRSIARTKDESERCRGPDSDGHAYNVLTSSECSPGTCDFNHVSTQSFPPTILSPSRIQGRGLFAAVAIPKGTPIIECAGDVVWYETFMKSMGQHVLDQDFAAFWCLCHEPFYLTVDASNEHTAAAYANHSCSPNSVLQTRFVNSFRRLILTATKDIPSGSEVTYDYHWELGQFPVACLCRAPGCRGLFGQPRALTAEEAVQFKLGQPERLRVEYSDDDSSDSGEESDADYAP
mmetsp:Transcript_69329/g.144556  ORF Transcript_69329/g.144556 Transcript_69329/m.144556 type:complete len:1186 (+) Transcript_69329:1738-5295(+)